MVTVGGDCDDSSVSRRYDAVFFDMGGTLAHLADAPRTRAIALSRLGSDVDADAVAAAIDAALGEPSAIAEYASLTQQPAGTPVPADRYDALWSRIYADALKRLDFRGDLVAAVSALYDHWVYEAAVLYPDVHPVFDQLIDAGYTLGIVSNWPHTLGLTCEHLGLTGCCPVVVASAECGFMKPHPAIFEIALTRAGVRPERTLYVGDRYDTDVVGARAVGMTSVLLRREPGDDTVEDVQVIVDLRGVLDLL